MTDGEEQGICMNCGAEMDFTPMAPWCPKYSECVCGGSDEFCTEPYCSGGDA